MSRLPRLATTGLLSSRALARSAASVGMAGTRNTPLHMQARQMSAFQDFVNNLKKGMQQAGEEAEKKAEEAKAAPQKPQEAEKPAGPSALGEMWTKFTSNFSQTAEELKKSEFVQQTAKVTEKVAEEAKKTTEEAAAELGKTTAAKKVAETAQFLKHELVDDSILSSAKYQPYRAPTEQERQKFVEARKAPVPTDIEENTEATGMVMHKDSRLYSQWKNFKDNNPLITRAFEWKMHYDESDNIFIRSMRSITDKIAEGFSSMFQESEMVTVLREIRKNDPSFDKEQFIEYAHRTLIPMLLESYLSGDVKALEDWCSEPIYNMLKTNIDQQAQLGHTLTHKILDIRDVDVFNAMMMEQGPVLTVTCMVQQILVTRDKTGKIVDGDPDNIEDCLYAFAFCREDAPFGQSAWRVIDFAIHMRRPTW